MLNIFLSSTFRDLKDTRTEIIRKLDSAFEGVGMEKFIPDGSSSQEVCIGNLKKIKDNGIVIFLISPYYGSLIESCYIMDECKADCPMKGGVSQISYTHCEYKTTIAEGILHQTYLIEAAWDAPDLKNEVLQFKNEIGKEYLGFINVEEFKVDYIGEHLAENILKWYRTKKLRFDKFCDRREELENIIKNIHSKVEVYGIGGVGKTSLIQIALLIQKLKGINVISVGTRKSYASGSGYEIFREKCREFQYRVESRKNINLYDVLNAFSKLLPDFEEIRKKSKNKIIERLSEFIRNEDRFILFIDDFHLADKDVEELVRNVDTIIYSSRRNTHIARVVIPLIGVDEKDRFDLINIFSEEEIPEKTQELIKKLTEGHPVSTELLVKNYQRINFEKLKDFDLKNASETQIEDFHKRVIEEILSSSPDALKLLKNLSVINTDLETNINRESVEKFSDLVHINKIFNELLDIGMLKKKKGKEGTYEFTFKHVQDALEDIATKKNHSEALKYYEKKKFITGDDIDDEVEVLFHRVAKNPEKILVEHLLEIKKKLHPFHYGFKRLIDVCEELNNSLEKKEKTPIYGLLGLIFADLGRFKDAEDMYLNALRVYKELAEKTPKKFVHKVAYIRNNLGNLYSELNRFEDAEEMYLSSLKLRKMLTKRNRERFLPTVADTWNNIGELYRKLKKPDNALEMYLSALNVYKDLARKKPKMYLPKVALTQNNLGILNQELRKFEKSEELYLKALSIREKLAKKDPEVNFPEIADIQNNLGILYQDFNRIKDALEMYLSALEVYKDLAKKTPEAYLHKVAMTQNNLGILYGELQIFEGTEEIFLDALKVYTELAENNPEVYLPKVAMTQNNLGNYYVELNRFENAQDMFFESLKVYKTLLKPNFEVYLADVAMAQNNLGILYFEQRDLDKAEGFFKKALEIEPNNCSVLYNIACLESEKNNPVKSTFYLKKAIDLDPSLIDSVREEEDFNNIRNTKEFKELIQN